MAETIDEDAQSINNPFLLELFKEGNSSGVMLDLDKGTWNVVKMEGTLGDIHTVISTQLKLCPIYTFSPSFY